MELNLDRLNGLRLANTHQKQPSGTPTTLSGETCGVSGEISTEYENALERQLESLQGLQYKADQNKAEIDRNSELYRTYQENIKRSGQLQTDILKGARAGEDIFNLFLKAVQAISLMTSNTSFYSQLEEDVKTIYGRGTQESVPPALELQQVRERLGRLREAAQRETEPDSIQRIRSAIRAHESKIAELEALIK